MNLKAGLDGRGLYHQACTQPRDLSKRMSNFAAAEPVLRGNVSIIHSYAKPIAIEQTRAEGDEERSVSAKECREHVS